MRFTDSRTSINNYFLWRKIRSLPAVKKIEKIKKLTGLKILDIGCGIGALMANLLEEGAEVTGIDTDKESLNLAKKFLKDQKKFKLLKLDCSSLPFKNNGFDIVFLFDVVEHVKNPNKTIEEAIRVLKPNGLLYVEFTPFYSIVGHHLYDLTIFPIHWISDRFVKNVIKNKDHIDEFGTDYLRLYSSLNKLRINDIQTLTNKMKPLAENYIIKYPELFEVNIPFIKFFGLLKDFFTMSFEGIYQKPNH